MSAKEMKIVTAGKVNITTERPDQNVSSKCFVITIKLIAVALQVLDAKCGLVKLVSGNSDKAIELLEILFQDHHPATFESHHETWH